MKEDISQEKKSKIIFDLHHAERPLMLPNIWDPLGALLLEDLGFPVVATSSSAVALTNGLQDGENMSFRSLLPQLEKIVELVSVPVTADVEKGYATDDVELEQNIIALIEAGIVGINFEDGDKMIKELVPVEIQCQRIKLIKKAAEQKGIPLFLNARTDTYIHSHLFSSAEEQLQETIKRGKAYCEAGAHCFFPILMKEEMQIKTVVEQVPLPVNIMAIPAIPSFHTLIEAGVKRISLGSSFLKTAMEAMREQALSLKEFKGQERIEQNKIATGYLESLIP